jgi:hypothetical protein
MFSATALVCVTVSDTYYSVMRRFVSAQLCSCAILVLTDSSSTCFGYDLFIAMYTLEAWVIHITVIMMTHYLNFEGKPNIVEIQAYSGPRVMNEDDESGVRQKEVTCQCMTTI